MSLAAQSSSADTTAPSGEKPRRARWGVALRRLVIIALSTYIGVCMLVAFLQSKLIYFPSRTIDGTPADIGLHFENLTLTTADGVRINAWYVPHPEARAEILFFHGNAGNNGDRLPELKVLNSMGFGVMIVDYRGYGASEGHPSEDGTYLDAVAAWEYLVSQRGIPPQRIVILGESLGGGVAVELAWRQTPGALVVQSSFTRLADVGAVHYPLLPVRLILQHRYDSVDKVGRIACPKLFIHSSEDTLIPLRIGKALFDAAAEPKKFMQTKGEHNSGGFMYDDETERRFRRFVEQAINGPGGDGPVTAPD